MNLKKWMLLRGKMYLHKKGWSYRAAHSFCRRLYHDLFHNKCTTFSEKKRAWKAGYFSSTYKTYGFLEGDGNKNLSAYLSDFAYLKMHPLNGKYSHWIDDKLTIRYMLSPFKKYLPKYYFLIDKNGTILTLPDCPDEYANTALDILKLLENEGTLAVKLQKGSLGVGFYRFDYSNKQYFINHVESTKENILSVISGLKNYLITEYLFNSQSINEVYSGSLNSLRVLAIHDAGKIPIVIGGLIRFGTHQSGVVDNIGQGGVYCLIDIATGYYSIPQLKDKPLFPPIHPDTKVPLEGVLYSIYLTHL